MNFSQFQGTFDQGMSHIPCIIHRSNPFIQTGVLYKANLSRGLASAIKRPQIQNIYFTQQTSFKTAYFKFLALKVLNLVTTAKIN